MSLTPEQQTKLILAYEPILYFHPDEKFVPVRPEAYMQASALWHSQPPSHKKEDWGNGGPGFPRTPDISKGNITVNPGEDGVGGKVYPGRALPDGRTPYLSSNKDRELWLDMAAWADGSDVTADSKNEDCNVDRGLTRWTTEAPLKNAGDWYYAEVQELDPLMKTIGILQQDGIDLGGKLREMFGDCWLIWYYFLYPIHQENLRGCEQVAGAGNNGNYEGDWNGIGIIVSKPATLPWETGLFPEPLYIGFGRRARGLIENFLPFFRQEMQVNVWGDIARVGRHPKVFVSRSSHNNYYLPGPHDPPAITPSDVSCGATEGVDQAVQDKLDELQDTVDTIESVTVTVAKVAAGCGIGWLIAGPVGCAVGAVVGGIAAAVEAASDSGDGHSQPVDDATKAEIERDHAPDEGHYGLVLAPPSLVASPDVTTGAKEVRPWAEGNHRLDRELQIWWPPTGPGDPGYQGRWGVMCQSDPNDRRSGIVFPDFRRAFLIDLATHLSN